ncbi:MAG: aminodeoxychorismate/anthranilate synthase component II [Alphaproteobacteria bacterium]|nr:MAG: aminodeoxychorismate/anthranilate synthase component II [Alphaproteobacteria bacterium]
MILVVDNYDSFTWNIVDYLRVLGSGVEVVRSDALSVDDAMASGADGFLLSPGPGRPEEAGISLGLVAACVEAGRPLLGICLGHQAIGMHFGGEVVRAGRVVHGKASAIAHDGSGLFEGLPSPFAAARYHSLAVAPAGLSSEIVVNASASDEPIMALRHATLPIHGVQFHPESIASEHGHALLANFLRIVNEA